MRKGERSPKKSYEMKEYQNYETDRPINYPMVKSSLYSNWFIQKFPSPIIDPQTIKLIWKMSHTASD